MTEEALKQRNTRMLQQCYPTFAKKVDAVIADLRSHDFRPRIQCAWRSVEEQERLYKQGRTKVKFGFHNVTGENGNPESLAVDLLDDDHPLKPSTKYLLMLASSAESHGLATGIRWGLSSKDVRLIDNALRDKNWDVDVKVGWDPCHVQIAGISIAQAKKGMRC